MSEILKHPLIDEDGRLKIADCAQALIRHGTYWYDTQNQSYFAYNGKHYAQVHEVFFEKRLMMLVGENFTQKNRDEVLDVFKKRISTQTQSDPELPDGFVNLDNGVLEIKTRILHKHSPKFKFFNYVPIQYNPKENCPQWEKFLNEILKDRESLVLLMQELFGYCLIPGNWLQVAFFLLGSGENGKSTLLEVLRSLLGRKNTASLSLCDLDDRFKKIQLWNKLANICEESPSSKAIDSELFKNLSAEGVITVEDKFKPAFQFKCKAKMVFAANSFPKFKDSTVAYHRRLVTIPFDYRIPADKRIHYFDRILLAELSGILNWSLDGLSRVLEQQKLSHSEPADVLKQEMIKTTDSLRLFLDENCVINPENRINSIRLYQEYTLFCKINGHRPFSNNELGKRIKDHFSSIERLRESKPPRAWYYKGITVSKFSAEGEQDEI